MEAALPPVTVLVVAPSDRAGALADALGSGDAATSVDVVGTVDAADAVATVAAGAPDVVVAVAGPDELAATGRIAADSPATRVLVVGTAEPDALVDAGVGAVVDPVLDGHELRAAVVGLHLGEARVDAPLARFVRERIAAEGSGLVPLTATEDEVLRRLADGEGVEALAEAYAVSPRLVRQVAGGALARVVLGRLVGA